MTPHSLSERGHIWHMRGPLDGKQGPGRGFPIRLSGYDIFIFGVPKQLSRGLFWPDGKLNVIFGFLSFLGSKDNMDVIFGFLSFF